MMKRARALTKKLLLLQLGDLSRAAETLIGRLSSRLVIFGGGRERDADIERLVGAWLSLLSSLPLWFRAADTAKCRYWAAAAASSFSTHERGGSAVFLKNAAYKSCAAQRDDRLLFSLEGAGFFFLVFKCFAPFCGVPAGSLECGYYEIIRRFGWMMLDHYLKLNFQVVSSDENSDENDDGDFITTWNWSHFVRIVQAIIANAWGF